MVSFKCSIGIMESVQQSLKVHMRMANGFKEDTEDRNRVRENASLNVSVDILRRRRKKLLRNSQVLDK